MTFDLSCSVAAWSHATAPYLGFDEWRKQLVGLRSSPMLAQVCKLGDEQTIVSAEAMYRAMDRAGWSGKNLDEWGIVSAPQFLGRMRMAAAVERFRLQNVRGASPRHIPTVSQHAVAGTLSVLFACRGPCFGAGGSQGSLRDALTTAVSLVAGHTTPGFWVTISQWTPELLPNVPDEQNASCECHAVAMAIVPEESPEAEFELGIRFQPTYSPAESEPQVAEFRDFLATQSPVGSVWGRSLAPGLWLGIRRRREFVPSANPRVA